MTKNYDYIIVGGGFCGLLLAKELSKKNKKTLVLEKGGQLDKIGSIMHAVGFYDKGSFAASRQGIVVYRAFGLGGTGVVGCGNAVMFTDEEYFRIGIDFKSELLEVKSDCCVRDEGLTIGKASRKIMDVANTLGYTMKPMPKFSTTGKCIACGECIVGCQYGHKWTSKECLKNIKNTDILTHFSVKDIITKNGSAIGVAGCRGLKPMKVYGDKIIVAAGGIGTPVILQNSGIKAGDHLFVDLFNMTYGISKEFHQVKELPMSAVCAKFHKDRGFVMAPFVDNLASFTTSAGLRHILKIFKLRNIMGIMTKIIDEDNGRVYKDGSYDKAPTENDLKKLKEGSDIAREILIKCGVEPKTIFVTPPKGAHPGGTAGIGRVVDKNLETKIRGLYVCDASVLPFAPGLPPMLSLAGLTKWFAKKI